MGLKSAGWESGRGYVFSRFKQTAELPVPPVLSGTRPAGGGRGHVPRHAFRTKASGSRRFYVEVSRLAWEKW